MKKTTIARLCAAVLLSSPLWVGTTAYAATAEQAGVGQTVTVKGVVTDSKGEPLPGASIMVKGTGNGTIADLDGNYTITVKEGQTLVVSFVGFQDKEIVAGAKGTLNVALDDTNYLDDVVVVGYGSIKKANLTGAVDAVGSQLFENRTFGNATQMLNEMMPNVEMVVTNGTPYQKQVMSVRGNISNLATINGDNQGEERAALILIDGVEGDLELINPNDIESVSVIKDAAAAAIYGARGSIGVILVTTKDPSKIDTKFKVDYSANFNVGVPTMLPDYITDPLEFTGMLRDAVGYFYADAKGNPAYSKVTDLNSCIKFKNGMGKDIDGYYNQMKAYFDAGNAPGVAVDKDGNYLYYGATDWYDEIYKSAVLSQIHNVSVSGNNGKIGYYVSGRLYDYDGLYKNNPDTYNTMNIRSKVTAQILPWLKLTENMDFTYDKIHKPLATKGTSTYTPEKAMFKYGYPMATVYNPDGTYTYSGAVIVGSMRQNGAFKDTNTKTFKTTTALTASFFDNTLRFNADYTYRMKDKNTKQKASSLEYSMKAGEMTNFLDAEELMEQYYQVGMTNQDYQAVNAYGEYENTFGKHYLKAMAGYNYEERGSQFYKITQNGMLSPSIDSFNLLASDLPSEFESSWNKWRIGGAFFRLNYNFDERYLLEINGRYDGSSKFSKNYQWAFFPSISAGWRVSSEPWWPISPAAVSNLKLRVSYGELGDAASIGSYGYEEKFDTDKNYSGKRVVDGNADASYWTVQDDEFNSSYTWATIRTINYGVDAGFFNGRLNTTFDYYIRRSLDMLVGNGNYSPTFGLDAALGNNADMSNYGWELTVNYNDSFMLAGKPFNFGFRGTLADSKTIIDRYPNETGTLNKNGADGFYAGMEIGEIWGYKVGGIWNSFDEINNWTWTDADGVQHTGPYSMATSIKQNNTKHRFLPGQVWFEDLNGDGTITKGKTNEDTQDWTIIGNKYPHYQFSLGFDFDWNNFSLNATFTGVGHQDWSGANGVMWGPFTKNHGLIPSYFIGNTWTEDNHDAFFPHVSYTSALFNGSTNVWNAFVSGVPTDRYTFNIGFIKLRNLQLGYTLPRRLTSKVGIEKAKVYVSGENLWTWSPVYKHIKGYDVTIINGHVDENDDMFNWGSDSIGSQYPILRTFSLGLNLTLGSRGGEKAAGLAAGAETAAAYAALKAAKDAVDAKVNGLQEKVSSLEDALNKALKEKEDCESAPKTMAQRRAEAVLVEDVYFDLNKADIKDSEAGKVDALISYMKANPETSVDICGYADQATGTESRNLMLTKLRAQVVADALKAAGISADRISTEFYGTEKDASFTPENNRLAACIVKK